jgi:hypothetical protein
MRINVYAEELTSKANAVIVEATPEGRRLLGVRIPILSPTELHFNGADDDRSAVTLWSSTDKEGISAEDLADMLETAAEHLRAEL